jgi:hypothetical protein
LKARAARREITPGYLPVSLGGYGASQVGTRIESPLEVNCLCLDDDESCVVVVSLDLLYVTHALREAVLAAVASIGIGGAELFMGASHTHYAPAIDSTKPLLGCPDDQYRDRVAAIVVEAIRDAVLGPKEEVTLSVGQGVSRIAVNRRLKRAIRFARGRFEFNSVGMSPNPSGPIDPFVSVVCLQTRERLLAYLWSAACHPTGLSDGACISAHFPGVVREHLRSLDRGRYPVASDIPVLFFQGFSGDVRPPSGSVRQGWLRDFVNRVRLGPPCRNLDAQEFSSWAQSAARRVVEVAAEGLRARDAGSLECARVELPASRFAIGAEHRPPVSFHRVTVGPVALVGASAEIVSGYAAAIRSMAPHMHVIPVSCIDHVGGYWPLHSMFSEGGYEVAGHCPSFGITACSPDIEATVLEQFRLLMDRGATSDRRVRDA